MSETPVRIYVRKVWPFPNASQGVHFLRLGIFALWTGLRMRLRLWSDRKAMVERAQSWMLYQLAHLEFAVLAETQTDELVVIIATFTVIDPPETKQGGQR
jgi:hypothetical protein